MNKILLALTLLGTGGAALLAARQSTTLLQQEANGNREAWIAKTQLLAAAQSNQASLVERIRQSKEVLSQTPAVAENMLWSVLRTNRTGHLAPELRERLLEELGFNWQLSGEFIVVSKETVRDIGMWTIRDNKLTDIAAAVLALTSEERARLDASLQRVQTDFHEWALSHTERSERRNDVVAEYTVLNDPAMTISNNFAAEVFDAVGRERAELIVGSASVPEFLFGLGIRKYPATMVVKGSWDANKRRLQAELFDIHTDQQRWRDAGPWEVSQDGFFPAAFRHVFPNGWVDVAKREGFELPQGVQKK